MQVRLLWYRGNGEQIDRISFDNDKLGMSDFYVLTDKYKNYIFESINNIAGLENNNTFVYHI